MLRFAEDIPVLPKRLSVIVNSEKILLPGCMLDFPVENSKIRDLVHAKLKKKPQSGSILIGVTYSTDVGTIGTAGTIKSYCKYKEESEFITLVGIRRFRIQKIITNEPYTLAEVTQIDQHNDCTDLKNDPKIISLVNAIGDTISAFLDFDQSSSFVNVRNNYCGSILKKSDTMSKIPPCYLAEMCCHLISFSFEEQLQILNTLDVAERLNLTLNILNKKDKENLKKPKVIVKSRSMGLSVPETQKLEERIKEIQFPPNIDTIVQSELKQLAMMNPINPQYNILHSHLTLVADLPWNKQAEETLDLRKTKEDLEIDHYGLETVKKRILEYLAVRKLRNSNNKSHHGPILCLVGPPGVGKTSIARSIAATLNRPFERVSLGGINNMSDIRGHRRAYVGAMPGRIIQALKRCGVKNPVILLDEIDKTTRGPYGDPVGAMLEVLDPAQNKEFMDHYLNIPFDLSQILFITTANSVYKLSSALYDRLEIIRISGYTYLEKLQIVNKYLLPKQLIETGLNSEQIEIPEETMQLLINNYTHEAGVRGLERKIGSLCRSVAFKIAINETVDNKILNFPVIIDAEAAKAILGPVLIEDNKWASRLGKPGVAIGLVVNDAGGGTMAVESSLMPGTGKLVLTGSLGYVMKESAQLAWGWVRSNAQMYGVQLDGKRLSSIDVHVHFPEGAVSKEGPSAGVTIAVTLMSLFLDRPVLSKIAMTGEITLQGIVLGVGGIKEKVISAHRDGFTKIVIPQENAKHLYDIPSSIKDDLTFVLVSDMHTIIETVFENGVNLLTTEFVKSKL